MISTQRISRGWRVSPDSQLISNPGLTGNPGRGAHAHGFQFGPAPREGFAPSAQLWGLRTTFPASRCFPFGDFRCVGCCSGLCRDSRQRGCYSAGLRLLPVLT